MKARSLLLLCVLNSAALVAEPSLEPDRTRRHVVAAGQTVRLELAAAPHDSFILLEVDQLDTDVLLRVTPESESETLLADQPLGFREPERLVLPPGPGYRVEIKARRRGAVGVRWRLADPDSARWPGDQAWSRATHAFAADTPESRLEAADAFEQAAALYEQAGLERDAARALACAGHVAADLGEGERGLGLLRRAIDRRRQSGPPHALAEAHHLLANALQRGRRLDASLSAFERSLEIFRELGDEPAEARALLNIGFISQLQGDAAAARSRYEVALAMARAHDDRSVIAKLLNNLGGLDYRAGDLGSAVRRLESLLVFQPEDDLRGRSRTLGNLASAQRLLGRYQESLDGFERALEIQETLGDPRIRAATLNNLGFTYLKLGETARARAYFERALPLRRRAEDPRGEAVTVNNLGLLAFAEGDLEGARGRFETALGLFRQATDPLGEGSSLQSLGRLELERGRLSEAEAALRASAALREAQNDVERGGEVKTLLARVLLARYPEQEARLREALVLTEEALGGHRTYGSRESEAEDLWVRSRIHRALGELERALGDLEAAREISESLRVEVESPDLRAGMLSLKRTIYEDLVDLMIADGRSAEAFAVADQARARGLLDVLARAGSPGLSAHNRDARRAVIEGLAEARFRVSRASRRGEPAEDAVREAHRLSIELDRLIADSRVDAPRAEQAAVLSAGEVQGLLDPATALLAFSVGERRSFAWLLTPGSLRSSVLPGRKRLAAGAEELYRELSTFDPRRRQVRQLEQLSSLLLEPLAAGGLAPTVSRLVVVAEGPLLRLPFAALTLPEGSGDLLDRFEILYLPSCSLLPWLRERSRERGAPRLLAVVADPRFHQAGDGSARGPSSLPSSRQEAEALQRLSGGRADSWLGGRAAKKALEGSSLEPYRFVHFATHATLDSGRPELSSLSLALFDDEGRPLEGPLRLHDIYELRLQADLVVLSGCETALGRDVLGEGFLGLTRGFFFAGASRVAASLWRVEDRATAELMASFYRAMIDGGESPSAALRSAQLELRRRPRYRDPFFWAAFGVQGDWRTR